jgi:hypothetical protein
VAVDALLLVAGDNLASRAGGASKKKALEVLARDHAASDKIGPLCQRLASDSDSQGVKLLRAVLEKNPSKRVQAEACLALTQSLRQRAAIAKRIPTDKEMAKRFEEIFGKETAAELSKLDPSRAEEEVEALAKQLAEKYVGEMDSADKGSE